MVRVGIWWSVTARRPPPLSYFTWDGHKFPTPEGMIRNVTSRGRKMVTIIDPHIKRDSAYFVHSDATANGYYVKDRDGNYHDMLLKGCSVRDFMARREAYGRA